MKWGSERRKVVSGMAEKLGLATVVASMGDLLVAHRFRIPFDLLGLTMGLILMAIAVIVAPDE